MRVLILEEGAVMVSLNNILKILKMSQKVEIFNEMTCLNCFILKQPNKQ